MDEELKNQEQELENQEQEVEQPDLGTPQEQEREDPEPEFYLDKDGNLQWNTEEFDTKEEQDSDSEAQGEEQTEESEDNETQETNVEEPKYKVKVDGEEIEVTQDELLRGYMRQRDYTQKTQQLAEQRRQFEQYRPQYQPQPQQQIQREPEQGVDNLNSIAKEMAARRLGLDSVEDLSELDFDHITAVVEAKQALINQRNSMMFRQQNINNLEAQLRSEEPKYDEIMANINTAMQNLPVSKFNTLKQAYNDGNPEPLREFFKEMQKDYYSKVIKKVENKKKPSVPVVEHSANTPITQSKRQNKIDFKQFGHMTTEQKAKILLERGFLD